MPCATGEVGRLQKQRPVIGAYSPIYTHLAACAWVHVAGVVQVSGAVDQPPLREFISGRIQPKPEEPKLIKTTVFNTSSSVNDSRKRIHYVKNSRVFPLVSAWVLC